MKILFTRIQGDQNSASATRDILQDVLNRFSRTAAAIEARDLDKINFRIRVAGEIWDSPGPTGFRGSRLQTSKHAALVDIVIGREAWSNGPMAMQKALVGSLAAGIRDIARRGTGNQVDLQTEALLHTLRDEFGGEVPEVLNVNQDEPSTGPPSGGKARARERGPKRTGGKTPPRR